MQTRVPVLEIDFWLTDTDNCSITHICVIRLAGKLAKAKTKCPGE